MSSSPSEFEDLAYHIGTGLIIWQHVEVMHFALFMKMLGAPQAELASIVYYSTESFEGRHRMISKMVDLSLKDKAHKKLRADWNSADGELQKDLKDGNDNRNKLAHYGIEHDVIGEKDLPDGSIEFEFGAPRLRPSPYNLVSELLGRTADKPEHDLSPTEIRKYILDFRHLVIRLDKFTESLPFPKPRLGEVLLQQFSHLPPMLTKASHRRPKNPPGIEPSGK